MSLVEPVRETMPSRLARGFTAGKRATTKALACRFDAVMFRRIVERAEQDGDSAAAVVRKLVAKGLAR